jgi:DNA-binding transcriptional MerR regulator
VTGAAAAENPRGEVLMSIGEVLAHLRTEFPDTTISKLRFLETEGLVEPRRTAAGYRKYSGQDVARLRYVLTAQRDQYLPLRVIRDRLAALDHDPEPADPGPTPTARSRPADATVRSRAAEPTPRYGPAEPAPRFGSSEPGRFGSTESAGRFGPGEPAGRFGAAESAGRFGAPEPAPRYGPAEPTRLRPALQAVGDPGPDSTAPVDPAEVHLSRADLIARAGLAESTFATLEQYGLITERPGGGYDADALEIAAVAALLGQYGLEARHLRAYRASADREIGLFSQLVAPLARQNGPAARARAAETVRELAACTERLHAALVRTGLRQTLGR